MNNKEIEERVQAYESMWGKEREHYILSEVSTHGRPSQRYLIVDTRTDGAIMIENNTIASEVVRRMLEAGVRVGDPSDIEIKKAAIRRRLGR